MSLIFGKRVNVTSQADKIAAFQSTTCDFGTPLPILYGTAKRGPNLINFQDFTTTEKKTTTKTGKRSSSTQIDYEYSVYVELALCEGVIDGIKRLWVANTEYASLAEFNANGANQGAPLNLNLGDNTEPTVYMQTKHGDVAVGYGRMAYLYGFVFLGANAASIPSYSFEVEGLLRASGDGVDANPADVIIDLLQRIGCAGYIDEESFADYKRFCQETDLLISTPSDAFSGQKKCQEIIKEILNITNAYLFWSVDRFKIVPRDDRDFGTWSPNRTIRYELTSDQMAKQSNGACVIYMRRDSSELCNRFGVQFTNRENGYETETIFYEDTTDILRNGVKTAGDFSAKWIHTAERAIKVAEMRARVNRTENVKYQFKLNWQYCQLEPGDLVTITDASIALVRQLVMIESITEDDKGLLTVVAVRRDTDTRRIDYNIFEHGYNKVSYNSEPGGTAAPLFITVPQELTSSASGLELWIALQGSTINWGGCDVYASTKDGNYTFHGRHGQSSVYGVILEPLTQDGTSVEVQFSNVRAVDIVEGNSEDAAAGLTDIWINGEFMSYTQAELTGANRYRLSGLTRGRYGSEIPVHTAGQSLAVIDSNLFSMPLTKNYLGQQLFFKFPSFNLVKKNLQDLNDVDYYTHTVDLYLLPDVKNLTASATKQTHDEIWYTWDIEIAWSLPEQSSAAKVYFRKKTEADWIYAGMGLESLTIHDISEAGEYVISVSAKDTNDNSKAPNNCAQLEITVS